MIALSTAFKSAQIAIDIGGKREYKEIDANCKVSENVLVSLDKMLDNMGAKVSDNTAYAVVVGPGSFTGLRIGVALVKGLCAGSEQENIVIPLSSLGLIAYINKKRNHPQNDFMVVLNALSGLYFVCEYDKDACAKGEEKLISGEALAEVKMEKVGLKEENLPFSQVSISPQELLEYAFECEKADKKVNVETFSPVYLRRSQAEVSLEEKNNKKV